MTDTEIGAIKNLAKSLNIKYSTVKTTYQALGAHFINKNDFNAIRMRDLAALLME